MLGPIQRGIVVIAVPFLALIGLAFLCARKVLAGMYRLIGWEMAWPPVLVDDDEQPPQN